MNFPTRDSTIEQTPSAVVRPRQRKLCFSPITVIFYSIFLFPITYLVLFAKIPSSITLTIEFDKNTPQIAQQKPSNASKLLHPNSSQPKLQERGSLDSKWKAKNQDAFHIQENRKESESRPTSSDSSASSYYKPTSRLPQFGSQLPKTQGSDSSSNQLTPQSHDTESFSSLNQLPSESVSSTDVKNVSREFKREPDDIDVNLQTSLDVEELLRQKFAKRIIISEKAKIIFCPIPKVANSAWKVLIRRLQGAIDYKNLAKVNNKKNTDLKVMADFTPEQLNWILNDPAYLKFTFVRDPFRRHLSSYLDKFLSKPKESEEYRIFIAQLLGWSWLKYHDITKEDNPTFQQFTKAVVSQQSPMMNEHWAPQSYLCGIGQFPYDFIGRLENLQQDSSRVFQWIGKPSLIFPSQTSIGFPSTKAAEKESNYYTSQELVDQVRKRFAADFNLFGYDPKRLDSMIQSLHANSSTNLPQGSGTTTTPANHSNPNTAATSVNNTQDSSMQISADPSSISFMNSSKKKAQSLPRSQKVNPSSADPPIAETIQMPQILSTPDSSTTTTTTTTTPTTPAPTTTTTSSVDVSPTSQVQTSSPQMHQVLPADHSLTTMTTLVTPPTTTSSVDIPPTSTVQGSSQTKADSV